MQNSRKRDLELYINKYTYLKKLSDRLLSFETSQKIQLARKAEPEAQCIPTCCWERRKRTARCLLPTASVGRRHGP